MKKRIFTAKFKADVVLELLEGEKTINELASTHDLHPNMIRNWKKEFLENAHNAFDDRHAADLKEELQFAKKEKEEVLGEVGRLTMHVNWLKKKSEEVLGPDWESQFTPRPKG